MILNFIVMYYNINLHTDVIPAIAVSKENVAAFYSVADIPTQKSFVRNYGGYIRSDIAQIIDEQNQEVAMQLSARLIERPDDTSDKSVVDILAAHHSKYAQTPSEMIAFIDNQLALRDQKRMENASEDERKKIEQEAADRRRDLFDSLSSSERDDLNEKKRKKEIYENLID